MFILVPTIIIFLCLSYFQLNDNIDTYIYVILWTIMILTVLVSFLLYKKVNTDTNIQDKNSITIEIQRLTKILNKTTKDNVRLGLVKKIELLQEELKTDN